ncbi:hypothetical protein TSAR_010757 [Trichomalopsis sarcophagae]|uniref:Uncharacterized protein n=1 Tax=Trichomalopsis sarcophagae TaxID=543379 RepID=A0A232EUR8_9HYME|nr:hypothetical protein TSAR_010757 [Trichomalopsis sarcophagae]
MSPPSKMEITRTKTHSMYQLHEAVEALDEVLIGCLIDSGANVNAQNLDGESPLHVLISRDWNHAFVPFTDEEKQCCTRIAEMLIRAGADVNIQRFVDLGCDPGSCVPILYEAAYFNNQTMMKVLINNGADVRAITSRGFTVLHKVLEMKDWDIGIVESLLQQGCDVNSTYPGRIHGHCGGTALHLALEHANCTVEVVKLLLDFGVDVNRKNERGMTASKNYLLNALELDLNVWRLRGINPALLSLIRPSEEDVGPLHQACIFNDFSYVHELATQPNVDMNAVDALGHTPLFYAVMTQSDSVQDQLSKVRLLLDLGADINQLYIMNHEIEGLGTIFDIAIRLRCRAREIYKTLVQHAAILVESNPGGEKMALSQSNLRALYNYKPLERTRLIGKIDTDNCPFNYVSCVQELREMKRNKIGGTETTFFDLLIADEKQSIVYARNSQICNAYESIFEEGTFPIYQEWFLDTNFAKAFKRQILLGDAAEALCHILDYPDPFDEFVQLTIDMLNDEDLKTLNLYFEESSEGFKDFEESSEGFKDFEESSEGFKDFEESSEGFKDFEESSENFEDFDELSMSFEDFEESSESFKDFDELSMSFEDFEESSESFQDFDDLSMSFEDLEESSISIEDSLNTSFDSGVFERLSNSN